MALTILSTLISSSSFAVCKMGQYEFSVLLSEQTYDEAYENGEALFSTNDHVLVKDTKENISYIFDIGTLEEDQAGNYNIEAISSQDATYFSLFHDHETWHEGLYAEFSLPNGDIIDLSSVKDCDYDLFFL